MPFSFDWPRVKIKKKGEAYVFDRNPPSHVRRLPLRTDKGGKYVILPTTCKTADGPRTHGTYIWGEFDDLQAVEDKIMEGPYIHHFVEIEGDCTREIKEFCKCFPNLNLDKID